MFRCSPVTTGTKDGVFNGKSRLPAFTFTLSKVIERLVELDLKLFICKCARLT